MTERIARLRPDFDFELENTVEASVLFRAMPFMFGQGPITFTGQVRGGLDVGVKYTNTDTGLTAKRMTIRGRGKALYVNAGNPHEAAALAVLADVIGENPREELRFEAKPGLVTPGKRDGAEIVSLPKEPSDGRIGEYEQYMLLCEGDTVEKFEAMAGMVGYLAMTDMLGIAQGRGGRALKSLNKAVQQEGLVESTKMALDGLAELALLGPYRPH